MRVLPSLHVRQGGNSRYTRTLKRMALGGRHCDDDTLIDTFPEYLNSDMDISRVERENVLSASYQISNTFFLKVITPRHLRAHQLLSWWRNTIFSMNRLPGVFSSFETPVEMAAQEFDAMRSAYNANGATSQPYEYTRLSGSEDTAALLVDYVPNAGRLDGEKRSLKAFKHVTHTMKQLHQSGNIHTNFPHHVLQSVPDGEPYMSDPVGRTTDTPQGQLLGVGFDIATLLAQYTPYVGAVPGIKVIKDYYNDVELTAAYQTAVPAQITTPNSPRWTTKQLRKSINELCSAEAADRYQQIIGTSHTPSEDTDTGPVAQADRQNEQTQIEQSSDSDRNPETDSPPDKSTTVSGEPGSVSTARPVSIKRFVSVALSRSDKSEQPPTEATESTLSGPQDTTGESEGEKVNITGYSHPTSETPERPTEQSTSADTVLLGEFDDADPR